MSLTQIEEDKIMAEINKLQAETVKLQAETAKMLKETKYYPWVIVVSASVATAITTLFALVQWILK